MESAAGPAAPMPTRFDWLLDRTIGQPRTLITGFNDQCKANREQPVVIDDGYRDIDRMLQNAGPLGFSGQVLIAIDGRVVLHKAYGFSDRALRTPVTTDTTFGIASMSKMFTAAAVLLAQEHGQLS